MKPTFTFAMVATVAMGVAFTLAGVSWAQEIYLRSKNHER